MATPEFVPYTDTPAGPATACSKNDYGVGDGVQVTYDLINKLGIAMGATAQSQDTFWNRSVLGSMTVDNLLNTVTLNSPPDVGAVLILPGNQSLIVRAYDVNTVLGDPSPRVKQYPFYVGPDSSASIQLFKFVNNPSQAGMIVEFVDKDPSYGSALTWLNIAAALPDGTPGAYQSATLPLYLPDLSGFTTTVNAQAVNDTSIDVVDGTQATAGMFLVIEPGTVREEQVKCLTVVGDTITTTPLGYAHAAGVSVFEYLQKCWVQTDFPLNASGGVPTNLNDIATRLICSMESRV